MMYQHNNFDPTRFYKESVKAINNTFDVPDDLCFVYVQHAFSPVITHFKCIEDRLAAVIPKGSSAKGNPHVVRSLESLFPQRVLSHVTRDHLRDINYTLKTLKDVTRGRPFAILEYGGYFAPAADAIANDRYLGPKLAGFVEGTENGIRGSDDGLTPGYKQVAAKVGKPIISKSKSGIKKIMDLEIGPAIVHSSKEIVQRYQGIQLKHWEGETGVIGLGSIGRGVLRTLFRYNINPMVFDADLSILAEMANRGHKAVCQQSILSDSDLLYLNTGSCFLSQQPELLEHLKDNAILVLCTSGDVEAGIPQLLEAGHMELLPEESNDGIAVYQTRFGKRLRIMLGKDQIGQAPNMIVEDGSGSAANLMSDMEFYAMGAYLGSQRKDVPVHQISEPPQEIEHLIIEQWLKMFYPSCIEARPTGAPTSHFFPVTAHQHAKTTQQALMDTAV